MMVVWGKRNFIIYVIALFFLFILFITPVNADTIPLIEWQKCLGGSSTDRANSIQQTSDGGYIVAGSIESNNGDVTGNHGGWDYWVVKLDSNGNIIWQKSLGGSGIDEAQSIQQTTDGGYIVAGISDSNDGDVTDNHGYFNYWVVKLDASGNIIWQKSLGGSGIDEAQSIQQTTDGGYIVAGMSSSKNGDVTGNHGGWDYWVVKLDASGNIIWQKSLGGTGEDYTFSIQQTSDTGYIVAGYSDFNDGDVTGNHGNGDYWVVKLDANGNIIWQKSLGGSSWDVANCIQPTGDGGYVVAGVSSSNDGDVTGNHGGWDYWVAKLDANGNIIWQKSLGGSGNDEAKSIQQTTDEGYIVAGVSYSNDGDVTGNHGNGDNWVVKLDANGNIIWQKSLGGSGNDVAQSIQQTTDGWYIVAGMSSSNDGDVTGNHGGWDYWVVKLKPAASSFHISLIDRAVSWAKSKEGSTSYEDATGMTYCFAFVRDAYTSSQGADAPLSRKFDEYYQTHVRCAKTAYDYLNNAGKISQGIPPKGAWVFYDVNAVGYSNLGHVGIAIDDQGHIVNVQRGGVRQDDYLFPGSSVFTYLGWAYPPIASPLPASPANTQKVTPDDVTFSWNNLDWANIGEEPDYYEFYISEQPYGGSNIIFQSSQYGDGKITSTSFKYPTDISDSQKLKDGTQYRWNVRAHYPSFGWDKPAAKSYFTTGDEIVNDVPVADFTISPEFPKIYDDIILDASKSRAADGSKIISYYWRIDEGYYDHSDSPLFHKKISTAGVHDIQLTVSDDLGRESQPITYQVDVQSNPSYFWGVELSGPEKTSNYETKHYTINIVNNIPENTGPIIVKLAYSPEYEIKKQSEPENLYYYNDKRMLNQEYSISVNHGSSNFIDEDYVKNAYWIIKDIGPKKSKQITFEIQLENQDSKTKPDLSLEVEAKQLSQLSNNALYPGIGWTPSDIENDKEGKDRLTRATDLDATLIKCLFETNDVKKLPVGFNELSSKLNIDIRGAVQTWFASNGIYTQENYDDLPDGDYKIIFSHSGGTQSLYQKLQNERVTADYVFFAAPALISESQMIDLINSGAVKKKIFIVQSKQDILYNAHVLDYQKAYNFGTPWYPDYHSGVNLEVAGSPFDDIVKWPALFLIQMKGLHTKGGYIDADPLLTDNYKNQLPIKASFWIGGSDRDYQQLFYPAYNIETINLEFTAPHSEFIIDDVDVHGYLIDWIIEHYNRGDMYPFDGSVPDLVKPSIPEQQHAFKKIDYASAHDPNEKTGPEGHYPSGQSINYKVEYENEGDGTAFDVYITDVLDPSLDSSTLEISPVYSTVTGQQIAGSGIYDSDNRTIRWDIGEVGPGEGGFANISVKFSPSVPDDTKVTNYATVYFPSAFEETQTNAIVTIKGVNLPPEAPNLSFPVNNERNLSVNGTLFWQCHDPNNETLTYDVYLGTTSPPPLVLENTTLDLYYYSGFVNEATYYWKVVAKDPYGAVTSSEVRQFTTIPTSLLDTTPPSSISELQNITYQPDHINWTWVDPSDSDFNHVMVYLNGTWKTNVTKGIQSYDCMGLLESTSYTIGTRVVDTTGNINATWVNSTATTAPQPPSDNITPPSSITNLRNVIYLPTSINWTWTDPSDSTFDHVMVYLNGNWKTNVTKGVQYYNATGLLSGVSYTIGTHTVDVSGNMNSTWVNDTIIFPVPTTIPTTIPTTSPTTLPTIIPLITPPSGITNLQNVIYLPTSINWTWTDPSDSTFDHVMVYLNGNWKTNVTKGVQYYNATGLLSGVSYTIGTHIVDVSGNVNSTWVNNTIIFPFPTHLPAINGFRPPNDLDSDGIFEDVNGDGVFSVFDVWLAYTNLDQIRGGFWPVSATDLDGNGKIELYDVYLLFKRATG